MGGRLVGQSKEFSRSTVEDIIRDYVTCIPATKIEVAGSYRRGKTHMSDLDVVIIPNRKTYGYITSMGLPILREGSKAISVNAKGLQIDFYFATKENFGAMLMRWTGPSQYNIAYSFIAKRRGWKLSQYGLFDSKGKKLAGRTESEIYQAFGKQYKKPEMRGK